MPPARRSRASPPFLPRRTPATPLPRRATLRRPMRSRPSASMPAPARVSAVRRNVPLRSLAAGAARARGGTKPPVVVSAFLSSGGWPPAREEKTMRIGRNASLGFPTHHPKSAKRTRVLLNTPHSTGLVSTTLHKAGSLLRENQNPFDKAFVIRVEHERQTLCFVASKTRHTFGGRSRAARGGSLRLRLSRASLWSLRSKECPHNL